MKKIKPDEYYSPLMLFKLNSFKWVKSYDTLKRWVKKDIDSGNDVFRTIKKGTKTATRYLIRGDRVLKIIDDAKKGRLVTKK